MKKKVSWNDEKGYNLETILNSIPIKKNKDNKENNDYISISPPIKIISPPNNYDWMNIILKVY
tara:strand:- start:1073 stop:1261 length:189 start_codon:yes stop_codon:yes gene_type:complete